MVAPVKVAPQSARVSRNAGSFRGSLSTWPPYAHSLEHQAHERTGKHRQSSDHSNGVGLPFITHIPTGHAGVYDRTPSQRKQASGSTVQYHVATLEVATPEEEQKIIDRTTAEFPGILARNVDQAIETHGGDS